MNKFVLSSFLLSLVIPCVLGIFDGRNGGAGGPLPGDQFPVLGTLLQCSDDDPNEPPRVGLSISRPGSVFPPLPSRYRFPRSLNSATANINAFVGFVNQLNINPDFQSLIERTDPPLYLPERYQTLPASDDYNRLREICGDDVLANVTDGFSRNADQGTFWDITAMMQSRWLEIWNNTDAVRQAEIASLWSPTDGTPQLYSDSFLDEFVGFFRTAMNVFSCRVAFGWADAGPTYFPRYFRGGFCLDRNCSLPDYPEFRCHPDLSFDDNEQGGRYLEAARWDCCWTYTRREGFKYECGFRKVQFPIVCDCDCRCADKAGI